PVHPDSMPHPTPHAPVCNWGERPPATPKLIKPRQSLRVADASAAARARPSVLQTTRVPAPAAMRASNPNPATAITIATGRSTRLYYLPEMIVEGSGVAATGGIKTRLCSFSLSEILLSSLA